MFSGIVKAVGRIATIESSGADRRVRIDTGGLDTSAWETGASIAVNGVCLTAVAIDAGGFAADVSAETAQVTTFGMLEAGAEVNLEPALRIGAPLDGHLVTGHVDCVSRISAAAPEGRGLRLSVEVPRALRRFIARKGSIALDGVSLTVNDVDGAQFGVMIVPHTLAETIIGHYRVGTAVNIEVDIVARYLERLSAS